MNQRISFQGDKPQILISEQCTRMAESFPAWKLDWKALPTLFRLWAKRSNDRRQLASMDDYLLKDIGISRFDAMAEANKPFWKE